MATEHDNPYDLLADTSDAGREGLHTEALGYVMAELQSIARAYRGATW